MSKSTAKAISKTDSTAEKSQIEYNHSFTRAIMIPEIVKLIAAKYHLSEMEVLDKFYSSATGASYADDETGLYGQSALYVFGLFCEEFGGDVG